uniref:RCC1-like domain-containing protein n=1 Tax=Globisporangium ultimum (strain ATCC 200006 / CBS 805.95 / DAOM BR144) TaxID=431595 RepID=K3WZG0_GLOUD
MSGKRARADGGISKEQYDAQDAFSAAPSTTGFEAFPRASESVLQTRKIVAKGSSSAANATTLTRASESHRQFTALNRAFAANIKAQWQHNKRGDWLENMKEYIVYARDITSKFGAQEGQVLTFGSGDCGQLGHGVEEDDDMMVKFPRVLQALSTKHIVRVACGGLHTGAIAASGEVYTWGCNDDGALGRVGEENFPAEVEGFGPAAACAVQIVGGDCHTAVVTLTGQVYTWGSYKDKEGKQWCDAATPSASFKQKQVRPFLIKGVNNAVDVRCGSSFNVVRTNEGHVYSWGLGEMGQLGREVNAEMKDATTGDYLVDMVFHDHLTPARMMLGKEPLPAVKAIGCGSYHSLVALAANGYLYTTGLNNYGQLGIGSTENQVKLQLVDDLATKNIASVEGGTHHSVVLTNDGDVYTFGRADSGQLGAQDTCQTGDFKDRPQKVEFLGAKEKIVVRAIAAGSNHALVLTEQNAIYSWGYGDMLALGNGVEQDETRPRLVDWRKTSFGNAEILQIDAGGQHSAVLARTTAGKST